MELLKFEANPTLFFILSLTKFQMFTECWTYWTLRRCMSHTIKVIGLLKYPWKLHEKFSLYSDPRLNLSPNHYVLCFYVFEMSWSMKTTLKKTLSPMRDCCSFVFLFIVILTAFQGLENWCSNTVDSSRDGWIRSSLAWVKVSVFRKRLMKESGTIFLLYAPILTSSFPNTKVISWFGWNFLILNSTSDSQDVSGLVYVKIKIRKNKTFITECKSTLPLLSSPNNIQKYIVSMMLWMYLPKEKETKISAFGCFQ